MDKNLSSENWYLSTPEGLKGPFSLTTIRGFVLEGQVRLLDEIYNKEEDLYQKAHEIFPDLIQSIGDGSFQPPPKPAVLNANKNIEASSTKNNYLELLGQGGKKKQKQPANNSREKTVSTQLELPKQGSHHHFEFPRWAQVLAVLVILGTVAVKYLVDSYDDSSRSPATNEPTHKFIENKIEAKKPQLEPLKDSALGTGNNTIKTFLKSTFSQPPQKPSTIVNPPPGTLNTGSPPPNTSAAANTTSETSSKETSTESSDRQSQYYDINSFDSQPQATPAPSNGDPAIEVSPEVPPSENQLDAEENTSDSQ